MRWQVLDTGKANALENMAFDKKLLQELSGHSPTLHFYEWDGECATYGYFADPYAHFDIQGIQKRKLQLARRPTGGGIVFHNVDFTFSVLIPSGHSAFSLNTLDNYAFVNRLVAEVVRQFSRGGLVPELLSPEAERIDPVFKSFCMAQPVSYDVMIDGRKLAGGAQRRMKQGFLHQGTLSLKTHSNDFLSDLLYAHPKMIEAIQKHSTGLLCGSTSPQYLLEARRYLRQLFVDVANSY